MDPMEIAADSEKSLEQIKECIKFKDSKGIKTFILEHKLSHQTIFWEVTSALMECMTEENLNNHSYFFETCERCLNYVVENGNPKEILLALLEQADCFKDDEKFKVILSQVQKTLLKLPTKRQHSLDITMETISAHVEALPIPADHDLENDEWRLLDLDPDVRRTHDVITSYLDFLRPFVLEVTLTDKENQIDVEKGACQRTMLIGYLMRLLDHPLLYLHMRFNPKEDDEKKKPYGRSSAEKLMAQLQQLCPSLFSLIEKQKFSKKHKRSAQENIGKDVEDIDVIKDKVKDWENESSVSKTSVANLLYVILKEYIGIENFPAVYTNEYILRFCLPYIRILLENDHSLVKFKAVYLLQNLVSNILPASLCQEELEQDDYIVILNLLITTMTLSKTQNLELRQVCVSVFPMYLNLFSLAGRYKLYKMIFTKCHHAGMIGFTIGLYKEQVDAELKKSKPDQHYITCHLQDILKLVSRIPDGATTDLLDNSDRIFAVLNFIRYLILRDSPSKNSCGIWNFYPEIELDFFGPLRHAIELSKGHFTMDLNDLKSGKKLQTDNAEFCVSVGGSQLSSVDPEQQIQVVQASLNTFDMMDSILSRIVELVDVQKRTTKENLKSD